MDAVTCIGSESLGIAAFDRGSVNYSLRADDRELHIDAQRRYYGLVRYALLQVERILGQRLRTAGTFDPAGLTAEIVANNQKIREAEEAKKKGGNSGAAGSETGAGEQSGSEGKGGSQTESSAASSTSSDVDQTVVNLMADGFKPELGGLVSLGKSAESGRSANAYDIDLAVLGPRLERCVIRAKL